MISPVFQLQQSIQAEIDSIRQKAKSLIFIFFMLSTLPIITILFWIRNSVVKPILILEKGTRIIGRGNLSHKIGTDEQNEIGQLSRAFDTMTLNLKATTTSIGQLEKEVEERKKTEEIIINSLKEKATLLSEIHHRVKNNLQVIISLLRLQSEKTQDEKLSNIIKESENRILSMALVHEQLYQSKNFSNIDSNEYITTLVNDLFYSNGVDTNIIKFNIECADTKFDLDNAIPCGLIINELVTNCLKHAFPDKRKGEIEIFFSSTSEDEFELTVSDNGVGFPKELDIKNTDSMGLHLVRVLAEETLEGKMTLEKTDGARFHFQLKKVKYRSRI